MKRIIIFLTILLVLLGLYNFHTLHGIVSGSFGNSSYENNKFLDAKLGYIAALDVHLLDTILDADLLYNLGNSQYRLGEEATDSERIVLWKESIGTYTRSLSIRTDKNTEENIAFVQKKLQKEIQKQENQTKSLEEQDKDNTGTGSKNDPKPEDDTGKEGGKGKEKNEEKKNEKLETSTNESTEKSGEPQKNWSNGGSYNPVGGKDTNNDTSNLSDSDRQEITQYLYSLKQFSKQNGRLLNPEKGVEGGGISDEIKKFFGNDSFFQDILPTDDSKKDW